MQRHPAGRWRYKVELGLEPRPVCSLCVLSWPLVSLPPLLAQRPGLSLSPLLQAHGSPTLSTPSSLDQI